MSKTLNSRTKQKYDTSINWTSNNPVLLAGELGIESDTRKFKFGDGVSTWTSLAYGGSSGGVTSLVDLGVTASSTELNYVDGVTSAIQTQIDGKSSTSHNHSGTYEPILGNPAVDGMVLQSTSTGVRSWAVVSGGSEIVTLEQLALSSLTGKTNVPKSMFYGAGYILNAMVLSSDITEIKDSAFYACANIPFISGENVTTIGNSSFVSCSSLASMDFPAVTTIGSDTFYGCAFTSLSLTAITSIGSRAFQNCLALTSVSLGSAVTTINSIAFNYCTNITSITINKPSGSVTGAPWGAPNATVTWTG